MIQTNFIKLPDSFWGYFARGHDTKGEIWSYCNLF